MQLDLFQDLTASQVKVDAIIDKLILSAKDIRYLIVKISFSTSAPATIKNLERVISDVRTLAGLISGKSLKYYKYDFSGVAVHKDHINLTEGFELVNLQEHMQNAESRLLGIINCHSDRFGSVGTEIANRIRTSFYFAQEYLLLNAI